MSILWNWPATKTYQTHNGGPLHSPKSGNLPGLQQISVRGDKSGLIDDSRGTYDPVGRIIVDLKISGKIKVVRLKTMENVMDWSQVINNPFLRDLPFKIELNKWGKILMSPASNSHGHIQFEIGAKIRDGK